MANRLTVSLMQRLENLGWPVLFLNEQLRMAVGSFDLANYLIYDEEVIDGPRSGLSSHPVATRFENWSQQFVKPSIAGRAWPFFIDVKGSRPFVDGTSKGNLATGHYTIKFLHEMIPAVGITQKDTAIVVPYLNQRSLYVRALAAAGMSDVRIVTADGFQGWDVRAVIWDMVSGSNVLPGFIADLRRINVSITRQMEALIRSVAFTILRY
jgi:hypothetical protein